MKNFSKIGLWASGVYLAFSVALLGYSFVCNDVGGSSFGPGGCELSAIFVALPWLIIFEDGIYLVGGVFLTGVNFYISSIILNALIIYFLFAYFQRRAEQV